MCARCSMQLVVVHPETVCFSTVLVGYWSSWYTEARDSADMKQFLGLEPEDRWGGPNMQPAIGSALLLVCAIATGLRGLHL